MLATGLLKGTKRGQQQIPGGFLGGSVARNRLYSLTTTCQNFSRVSSSSILCERNACKDPQEQTRLEDMSSKNTTEAAMNLSVKHLLTCPDDLLSPPGLHFDNLLDCSGLQPPYGLQFDNLLHYSSLQPPHSSGVRFLLPSVFLSLREEREGKSRLDRHNSARDSRFLKPKYKLK